jgi:glyoxylase-like metal-dependent hydrolase (beta-lactamase superfamily II)
MDTVHRIPIQTPFEIGRVNCYAFTGEGLTLLDPGPADEEAYAELHDALAALGYDLGDIDRILITHPHIDHYGLANRIKTETGARVLAHADAAKRLADPRGHFEREQAFFGPFLASMGVPDRLVGTVVGLAEPYLDFQEPVTIDRKLTDGDTVDVGTDLEAIATPGHAPGSISFVSRAWDAAFTGDHVLAEISPNPLLTLVPGSDEKRTRSLPTYLESLKKLRATGVRIGYGGHRGIIEALPERITETLNHHEDRKENIADLVAEDGSATAYAVMREMFPDLPATEMFPGMSEVIGHLDLLEDEARVNIQMTNGVKRYVPAQLST